MTCCSFSNMATYRVQAAFIIAASLLAVFANCQQCQTPTVKSKVYSTTDATVVSDIAFVAEFSVTCKNSVTDLTLYANTDGDNIIPVIRSTVDRNKYQVSWTQVAEKVKSGTYEVKIYDQEGYSEMKKSQRTGDKSNVVPLFTVNIKHQGSYFGPLVQSEFLAAAVSFLVWYFAYSSKSKIMS